MRTPPLPSDPPPLPSDPPPRPSDPPPPGLPVFAGATLDRASGPRHDEAWVAARRSDPGAVAVLATEDGVILDSAAERLARVPLAELGLPGEGGEPALLLGLEGETPLFGHDLGETDRAPGAAIARAAAGRPVGLREAGALLPQGEGGLAATLLGLLNWHRRHRFCAGCGAPSVPVHGGHARRCTRCGTLHFPRTDPAVIMLVEDRDRVLLGRRAAWPQPRYSVLAGFVSPGETLEEAVVREVAEEAAIVARRPRFVASQPWPFPASLMLGFHAVSDGGDPEPSDGELADVRWFTRAEVRAALAGEPAPLALPGAVSIAHLLIRRWAVGEL